MVADSPVFVDAPAGAVNRQDPGRPGWHTDNQGMSLPWTTRPVRVDDAAVVARHRYADTGSDEDLRACEHWLAVRIERGTYAGVLADAGGAVVAGAGAVLLDGGPTRS